MSSQLERFVYCKGWEHPQASLIFRVMRQVWTEFVRGGRALSHERPATPFWFKSLYDLCSKPSSRIKWQKQSGALREKVAAVIIGALRHARAEFVSGDQVYEKSVRAATKMCSTLLFACSTLMVLRITSWYYIGCSIEIECRSGHLHWK